MTSTLFYLNVKIGCSHPAESVNDAANWTWEQIEVWLRSEGFNNYDTLDRVKRSLEYDPSLNLQNIDFNTLYYMWDDTAKREILDARDRLFAYDEDADEQIIDR